jgi:hypothetical protein
MKLFGTRILAYLPVSAIVAFCGIYGAFNVEPVAAIATTVIYTVVALVFMYPRSRSTS